MASWEQLAAGYASTKGRKLLRDMVVRPLLLQKEAGIFFVHFDQKGPVKLVAEHNQARVVSDVKKPLHFPEQPPVC